MYMVIKSFTASIIWGVVGICVFHTYLYNMKHYISMLICTCSNYVVKIKPYYTQTPDVHIHVHVIIILGRVNPIIHTHLMYMYM